jgi:uncharacterized phage-like protein YoqJ
MADVTRSCCFTGHRPEKLKKAEEDIKKGLETAIDQAIKDGFTTFITGMAQGVDIWAGQMVLCRREANPALRLVAALAYPNGEKRWAAAWKKQYVQLLEAADEVVAISPAYHKACYQKRDEWMVNHASRVIAVYDGVAGGTKNTIEYARKCGVEVSPVQG